MLQGLPYVQRAKDVLVDQRMTTKERLTWGAKHIWSAIFYYEYWPPHVQDLADEVQHKILAHGHIRVTVAMLNERQAGELIRDLRKFAERFERISSGPKQPVWPRSLRYDAAVATRNEETTRMSLARMKTIPHGSSTHGLRAESRTRIFNTRIKKIESDIEIGEAKGINGLKFG